MTCYRLNLCMIHRKYDNNSTHIYVTITDFTKDDAKWRESLWRAWTHFIKCQLINRYFKNQFSLDFASILKLLAQPIYMESSCLWLGFWRVDEHVFQRVLDNVFTSWMPKSHWVLFNWHREYNTSCTISPLH